MAEMTMQARYRVEGMDCGSCAAKIDAAVRRSPGVSDVAVSVSVGTLVITHDGTVDLRAIEKQLTGLGYLVGPIKAKEPAAAARTTPDDAVRNPREMRGDDKGTTSGAWWQSTKAQLTIGSGIALVAAYGIGKVVPGVAPYAFIAAMLVGLIPIARRAFAAARAGTTFSIEMLMTIAAVGAVFIDAAEEAAAVVFLFLVGELLEGVAAGRARASIQSLTALVPKTALLDDNGQVREVPAESLAVGATILVRPGDRIAADGEIMSGDGSVDESSVTGESMPVRKGTGASVFAGTINGDAALRVRVTATAADNTIARVVRLVEEAQESKAPTERFIDRFSRYYTPAVVIVAALVAVIPPAAVWRRVGRLGLQGPCHLADRLPVRARHFDASGHSSLVISRSAARTSLKGWRRAGNARHHYGGRIRQDGNADRRQAQSDRRCRLRSLGGRRIAPCGRAGGWIKSSTCIGHPRPCGSRQDRHRRCGRF